MLHKKELKRISLTIDSTLLENLDNYVRFKQLEDQESSRSGVICDLVQKYIPVE